MSLVVLAWARMGFTFCFVLIITARPFPFDCHRTSSNCNYYEHPPSRTPLSTTGRCDKRHDQCTNAREAYNSFFGAMNVSVLGGVGIHDRASFLLRSTDKITVLRGIGHLWQTAISAISVYLFVLPILFRRPTPLVLQHDQPQTSDELLETAPSIVNHWDRSWSHSMRGI